MPQAFSIPAGFHSAIPYLIFDATAADAIAFYRDVFAAWAAHRHSFTFT
jgi:uncharacterized glyoxalase superfamily protein PhnB